MTEKRFDVVYEEDDEYKNIKYWEIIDTKSQNSTSNELEIVNLLNELDERWIGELNLRETLLLELQRVEEENKELKAQLYCDDESVCNICKHQQLIPHKVMQGYYTAKCEKGHKECSKEDLRHCNDFKFKELEE